MATPIPDLGHYPDPDPYQALDSYQGLDPYQDLDPYADRSAIPYTDAASRALLDDVVASLVVLRGGSTHDPGATISVLVSLDAEIEDRLANDVWLARHHGFSWDQVAERLGLTPGAARRRYSEQVRSRSEHARQLR